MNALPRYESYRGIESLRSMWTLSKNARTAACALITHPLAWEVTITLNGELIRSQVCKTETAVVDMSYVWRKDWEAKGWTA